MTTREILESQVQRSLIKKYEADGWFVVKLILTTKAGICYNSINNKTDSLATIRYY